jgi:uncharacterized protein (TIGR03435 family)
MKHILVALAMLVALLTSGIAQAQDLTGTWQGKLQLPTNAELRLVVKLTKDAAGTWRPLVYSIDQTPQGVTGTVTVQGTTVTIAIPAFGATIDGKLSADGNSIAGTFAQGPGKLPLTLARATGDAVWELPATPAALKPMPATANPSFEVATIKPARPEEPRYGITLRGRDVVTWNTTLMNLLTFAYGVHPKQVEGLPEWATTDKYEITARPDGDGLPNDRQLKSMFQKLLAERFKLTLHRDKKEQSVYELNTTRAGSKMTPSAGDPNGLPGLGFQGLGKLVVVNATMADFASLFQTSVLDRPVVDQTGLTGRFDFTLNWTPDESQFRAMGVRVPPPPDNATLPNLFTAIQEQIGLRLEATRAPADVLVVDKVDKPSEN